MFVIVLCFIIQFMLSWQKIIDCYASQCNGVSWMVVWSEWPSGQLDALLHNAQPTTILHKHTHCTHFKLYNTAQHVLHFCTNAHTALYFAFLYHILHTNYSNWLCGCKNYHLQPCTSRNGKTPCKALKAILFFEMSVIRYGIYIKSLLRNQRFDLFCQ